MRRKNFDRTSQDIGNIISLEHVNVTVPDQLTATLFYVNGLGLTRDPYMDFGPVNVWINAGRQQFHLPTARPQVLRGRTGLVVPDLDSLERRLSRIAPRLVDTRFGYQRSKTHLEVTCPWGNRIRCLAPGQFGEMQLGIPWVEIDVPMDTSAGIARFYEQIMGCRSTTHKGCCEVRIGQHQRLRFKERKSTQPEYDGHHIAVYVSDFSGPHRLLIERGLVTEESDEHQYRFQDIFDPETGEVMFELEHEVRSLFHPMYERNLVNRNAEQQFFDYRRDRDTFVPI